MKFPVSRKGDGLRRALFLCETNFLASRFCEELVDSRVRADGLNWLAVSRAYKPGLERCYTKPVFAVTIEWLRSAGIAPVNRLRLPLAANTFDFETSFIAVAIAPTACLPSNMQAWSKYSGQIEHWPADPALSERALLHKLAVSRTPCSSHKS